MLAIDSNKPGLISPFPSYTWIDEESINLVSQLLRSQRLSGFLGQTGSEFLGGEWVKKLEQKVSLLHDHKYVVSFNSWTSGLDAIFLSLNLGDDAEVIVPTWTMSATISAIVNAGYRPVFVDIDLDSFNISVADVINKVGPKTKAICAVDLFGRPSPILDLKSMCEAHGLVLVTDSAQTPGATIGGRTPSKIADVGGYSLNRHKHLQSGEGGLVVTDNHEYAERLRALRNHGEVATPEVKLGNRFLYGHNWRLGEIEALIAFQQFLKFDEHLNARRNVGMILRTQLSGIPGLIIPSVEFGVSHDHYVLGMRIEDGRNRAFIESALRAEGLTTLITRYSGLESLPAFQQFNDNQLPNAKLLNEKSFIGIYLAGHHYSEQSINEIESAFRLVFSDRRSIN